MLNIAILACIAQMGVLWLIMASRGVPLDLPGSLIMIANFVLWFLGGVLLNLLIAVVLRRTSAYLAVFRSGWWWITTVQAVVLGGLTSYFYVALKTSVWLLRSPVDQALWNLDLMIFFGMSPNVFVVSLFEGSPVVGLVDATYGPLFFVTLTLVYCLMTAVGDIELRTRFYVGSLILWSLGAWGYLAVPGLGPAYGFSQVWENSRADLPRSTWFQKRLMENHQQILELAEGNRDVKIRMGEAIGAFPSLHVGFFAFLAFFFGRGAPRLGRWLWVATAWMFFGSILTGWHYLVDSIAGLLLAWLAWVSLRVIFRKSLKPGGGEPAEV